MALGFRKVTFLKAVMLHRRGGGQGGGGAGIPRSALPRSGFFSLVCTPPQSGSGSENQRTRQENTQEMTGEGKGWDPTLCIFTRPRVSQTGVDSTFHIPRWRGIASRSLEYPIRCARNVARREHKHTFAVLVFKLDFEMVLLSA